MSDALHILQHSLGLDEHGRGRPYRNHFVAGKGHDDFDTCVDLVKRGLMERRRSTAITGGDDCFIVTYAGRAYVAEHSPLPPKLTRSQRRFQAFLDEDSGLSFGEWLRAGGSA